MPDVPVIDALPQDLVVGIENDDQIEYLAPAIQGSIPPSWIPFWFQKVGTEGSKSSKLEDRSLVEEYDCPRAQAERPQKPASSSEIDQLFRLFPGVAPAVGELLEQERKRSAADKEAGKGVLEGSH